MVPRIGLPLQPEPGANRTMRRILVSAAVLLAVGAFLALTLGASGGGGSPTYKIELDNAFGLVNGADFKVAGVISGSIKSIGLCSDDKSARCENPLHALVTVQSSQKGFGQFHQDAFCQSRPQSLIGEYFIDCEPGTGGKVLRPGSTITASHTQSTIPAHLVQNIMRLPYRQRFTLILNQLGAALAARSEALKTSPRRAVLARVDPVAEVARPGVRGRQAGGQGGDPDGRTPEPVRQADAGARAEPVDRAASARHSDPNQGRRGSGRARSAQRRRQGLQRA